MVAAVILTGAGMPTAFAVSRLIALFLITSVATNVLLIVVGGFGVAAGVLPGHATLASSLLPAVLAVVVIAAFAILFRSLMRSGRGEQTSARPLRRWIRLALDGAVWSAELLRRGDPLLVLGALGFVLCDLAALAAAFAAVGATPLPIGAMFLAYSLGQIGSVISIPGTTEGGLIGGLVLYGAPLSVAVSAVLVYRTIATLVPLTLSAFGVTQMRETLGEVRFVRGEGSLPIGEPGASAR